MRTRKLMSRFGGALAVALLAMGGPGCSGGGEQLNPVTGKVMYKGQPLAGALVTLHPKGNNDVKVVRPTGFTKSDGTFSVTTGQNDGAPAGEYVVTLICSVTPPGADKSKKKSFGTGEIETVDLLGGAYADVSVSKLTVTVKAGKNELATFDLK